MADFVNIEAGSRVWLGDSKIPQRKLATVDRITDTQIVIGKDRYYRQSGRRVGSSWNFSHITGVATLAEQREYAEKEHREAEERKKANQDREALELRRKQLWNLFDGHKNVSLGTGMGSDPRVALTWDVTFHDLSDREVLELAQALRKDDK